MDAGRQGTAPRAAGAYRVGVAVAVASCLLAGLFGLDRLSSRLDVPSEPAADGEGRRSIADAMAEACACPNYFPMPDVRGV
jgi:hypothetical protein